MTTPLDQATMTRDQLLAERALYDSALIHAVARLLPKDYPIATSGHMLFKVIVPACDLFNVKLIDLLSSVKKTEIADCRKAIAFVLWFHYPIRPTLSDIARMLGRLTHGAIINAYRRAKYHYEYEPEFAEKVNILIQNII